MVIFFNEKGEVKFQIIKYNDMFYELQVIDNMLNEQLHLTKKNIFNMQPKIIYSTICYSSQQ